eukprot:530403-Pyramimonas_sp.AAC.1
MILGKWGAPVCWVLDVDELGEPPVHQGYLDERNASAMDNRPRHPRLHEPAALDHRAHGNRR